MDTCCLISTGTCFDNLKYLFVSGSYTNPGISFGFVTVGVVGDWEFMFVLFCELVLMFVLKFLWESVLLCVLTFLGLEDQ